MKKGGSRSISRIRTFDEDVARARGIEIPKAPQVKKEKETAQDIADSILSAPDSGKTILREDTKNAADFIGTIETDTAISPKTKATLQEELKPVKIPTPPKVKDRAEPEPTVIDVPKKNNTIITTNLETEVNQITSRNSQPDLSTQETVYDASNNDLSEGTLVTNKKRRKFRLFPAIAASVRSWFGDTTTKITTSQKPQHTINKAESRIETITAAARASKHAPQSDHGVVVKRLTKTKRKKQDNAVSITKKEDVAVPQWSSTAAAEEPEIIPTTPIQEFVKTEVAPPPATDAQPEETTVPPVVAIPEPVPEVKEKKVKKKKKVKQHKVPHKKRSYRATPKTTSGVPIYIYLLVIVGASLLGIGVSAYWFMSSTPAEEIAVIRIPSLFTADVEVSTALSTDREITLSTILDMSITSRETTLIYPTITNAQGLTVPADAQTILNALAFRAPGSFTRAITDITFGSYNGTDSFILMKATSFDTAFGGLLSWEPDMSTDLSPLFGIPVTQSFDPYARTDTQVRSAFFRDTVVANKSVRLLVDAQDNERLLYAFVTPNLILIAPNSGTFKAVLPLVTQ